MSSEAFLSYAHSDDHFLDGGISWLRERLEISVRATSGRAFTIFQDTDGIKFGQHWPKRLSDALQEARFLIPILTPSYFTSPNCRAEVIEFLEYESAARRDDLILPIYLIGVDAFENDKLRKNDELMVRLYERQYRDWRFCVPDIQGTKGIKRHVFELADEIDTAAKRSMIVSGDTLLEEDAPKNNHRRSRSLANKKPNRIKIMKDEETIDLTETSDAILTISRKRTFIDQSNADSCKGMWHLLNRLRNVEPSNEDERFTFIWSLDFGPRIVEEQGAFDTFANVAQLAFQFHCVKKFDTIYDHDHQGMTGLSSRARIFEPDKRKNRWDWFVNRTVIIAMNLRREEFEDLYQEDDASLRSMRISDIGISSEHVLPSITPPLWSSHLKEFHDDDVEVSDATFTVFLSKKDDSIHESNSHRLRYLAHIALSDEEMNAVGGRWTAKSIELPSPGQSYDEAIGLMYLAARYRLGKCTPTEVDDGLTAVAYLRKFGFQVLRLPDFLRTFDLEFD